VRLHPRPRGPDDREHIATGRASGQSRRRRFPAFRGRGRGAAADGDRRGGTDRCRSPRAFRRAHDLSQRLSRPGAGHPARQPAAAHSQAAAGQLLPAVPGAAQDVGESPGGGDPGGLGQRRVHPACGRPGAGHGAERHRQEHGLQAVQGHRRAGGCLPGSASCGRLALSLAGRDVPQAARGSEAPPEARRAERALGASSPWRP